MLKPHEKLRALIEKHQWTQQDAANVFGVSQATIFRWKEEKVEPEGKHRDAINKAYQIAFCSDREGSTLMLPVGIPVVGFIRAGNWLDTTLIDENAEEPEIFPIAAGSRH